MSESKSILLSIYGARISEDGKRLVLTLVGGENNEKQFYTACVKLDNTQKTHAKVEEDGEHALLKVVMLKDKKEPAEDMPF